MKIIRNQLSHQELPPGIAPERTGSGTYDDDWTPGKDDPHTGEVIAISAPGTPGIRHETQTRIGAAGIELSHDGGVTWEPQAPDD